MMADICTIQKASVKSKIPCLFQSIVQNTPSSKRPDQQHKVIASDQLHPDAFEVIHRSSFTPTEKLDGTCTLVHEHGGVPWLWARHDRKPNKITGKQLKNNKFSTSTSSKSSNDSLEDRIHWNIESDYKEPPFDWIPASGVLDKDGKLLPEVNGHIPGWVPVDPRSRQHCWHASVVDLHRGFGLVLQPASTKNHLEIDFQPLGELIGCTLELIGTCINGNPYKLGSKQKPVHVLVRHSIIRFSELPPINYVDLVTWFENNREGRVEGIVWHCVESGLMFKLHRHHMDLKWPVDNLKLLSFPVKINIDVEKWANSDSASDLMRGFVCIAGSTFESLDKVSIE